MSRASCRIALAGLIVASLALPALYGQAGGRIAGQVQDTDGKPVVGVLVTFEAVGYDISHVKESDKKGKFTVAFVDATKKYRIRLEKEGFQTVEEPVDPQVGAVLRKIWILQPAGATAGSTLSGTSEVTGPRAAVRTFNEAAELYRAGEVDAAVAKFKEVIATDPSIPQTYQVLGGIYYEQEDFASAVAMSEQLLAIDPNHPAALKIRFESLDSMGNSAEAEQALATLIAADPSPDTAARIFNAGVRAYKGGATDRAVSLFESSLAIDPSIAQAHSILGQLAAARKQYDKALAHADKLLALEPDNFKGQRIRFDSYKALGDEPAAQAAMAAMASTDPAAVAEEFFDEGLSHFEAGNMDEAIPAFEAVIAADPGHARGHYQLGLAYASAGRTARAKELLQRFVELAPDDPEVASAQEMIKYLN